MSVLNKKQIWNKQETASFLEGSQASLIRPYDKGSVKMKISGWLAVAWDRGREILIIWINVELHNLRK
jgi:hypothetical protein